MKYQRAMAEVIRFDYYQEFMAASPNTIRIINDYIDNNFACNGFKGIHDDGSFTCKKLNGNGSITIQLPSGEIVVYHDHGNTWGCAGF